MTTIAHTSPVTTYVLRTKHLCELLMIQAPRRGRLRFACSTECSGAFHSTARGYHVAFGLGGAEVRVAARRLAKQDKERVACMR